jgi:hypothetical protein
VVAAAEGLAELQVKLMQLQAVLVDPALLL